MSRQTTSTPLPSPARISRRRFLGWSGAAGAAALGGAFWSIGPTVRRTRAAAPADTPLRRLVELAHSRWPIEQFYEDAKGECGLDHYQGRRWDGLHRHLALVMLAYSFLACQRWTPADPAGFSPLRGAPVVPRGPSPGPPVALPGCGVMAHRDQSNCSLPPHAELTK